MNNAVNTQHTGIAADQRGQKYYRKYVWEIPVRMYHWINVICICVLFATGLYISWPLLAPSGEATFKFVMGLVRQIHFIFAFIFIVNFLIRIYWFWVGNNYARSGFPFVWRNSWWKDLRTQLVDYLSLKRGHIHLGHNALGGLAYTIGVIFLTWAQIFTGLALFSESNPGGILDSLFGWVLPLMGGSFMVHMWHHLFAWGFIVFAILHVYIVVYDGHQYRNGLISSIISGNKFYLPGDFDQDKWLG